uniref:Uncharacterized protein n=1 Tax=Amorphochlora amoebiformis TaxID=1561963 RepID=A0A7S0H7B6_9EUKA|eukprot:1390603-Amorphochlora_amoeboformis.AAC.3
MSDFLSQVRALREKSDDSQHSPSLTSLAEQGDIEGVKRVLSEGKAEVNAKDSDGWPPLVAAARDGKIEVVKCLIQEAEAEVDVRNDDELRPTCVPFKNTSPPQPMISPLRISQTLA